MPPDIALTVPVLPIVATPVILLVQVPPLMASVRVVLDPAHRVVRPVIVPAFVDITEMLFVAVAVPQRLVMS